MTNTRVRAADGIMITVYVICIRPAVDPEMARRERSGASRQDAFSRKGNFLHTHISQRLAFRALPLCRRALMRGVILPAQVAPLVSGTREPMLRGLFERAAMRVIAVALPSVVRSTDEEPRQASPAAQLEHHELVHPSRMDENWTAASGSTTVRTYWLSIRRLYMRVQAPTWALLRFTRYSDLQDRPEPRDFLSSAAILQKMAG
jgi:hypothetical protein